MNRSSDSGPSRKSQIVSAMMVLLLVIATYEFTKGADEFVIIGSVSESNEVLEYARELRGGSEDIVIDLGDIHVGTKVPVRIDLTNTTNETLELVELKASCSCVGGRAKTGPVAPRTILSIELTIQPNSILDNFQQQVGLYFKNEHFRLKNIRLQSRVVGDVEVSPRSLTFDNEDETKVLKVKTRMPGIRLDSFDLMSSSLSIQSTEVVSENETHLHVSSLITSGQAVEHLRVRYTDSSRPGLGRNSADLSIGVISYQGYRFVPSAITVGSPTSSRVFLLLNGEYCPADGEGAELYFRMHSGEYSEVREGLVSLQRRKSRMWELKINADSDAVPSLAEGLVIKFAEADFLLPFTRKEK